MIRIAVLGCGTVGSGVIKLLQQNGETIAMRAGEAVELKWALDLDKEKCRASGVEEGKITDQFDDILNDDEVDIVVELIGGIEPAFSYIISAMNRGKHVVTANKDLIAVKGQEIFAAAEANQVDFYFEASVAGGIPIIGPLKQSLAGNRISQVIGILNGTTNYILTKMSREKRNFEDVLAEAQALGYAESDPTADVEGLDAARKIAILSSIAFNSRVTLENVYVEGISKITPEDIKYADELGFIIKLLAIGQEKEGQIQTRVHPAFLPKHHPLAAVNDVFNAVYIKGDAVGEIMHFGRGAGQMPTASSVMGDIIEIIRNIRQHTNTRVGCTCYEEKTSSSIDCLTAQFYIRMTVTDQPGVLAGIAGVFGDHNVSLATVLQKTGPQNMAELILITHDVVEKDLRDSLEVLQKMPMVGKINNVIRLEGVQG